jgi:hypothetical protein
MLSFGRKVLNIPNGSGSLSLPSFPAWVGLAFTAWPVGILPLVTHGGWGI